MGLRPFVVKRATKSMGMYQFFLGIVLGIYVGFLRLNQLRFIAQDPLLTGILKVSGLPPQSTLWRFLAALHLNVAVQILRVQQQMRERVWAAAHVRLAARGRSPETLKNAPQLIDSTCRFSAKTTITTGC